MNILFFLTPKKDVCYLPSEDSLRQAWEKMKYHGYTAVPMLTEDGRYAGTITEGDILRAMEDKCHWDIYETEHIKACDVARKRDNQAISVETEIDDLVDVIKEQNFVPVNDDQNHFIGIITRKDVIDYYYNQSKK